MIYKRNRGVTDFSEFFSGPFDRWEYIIDHLYLDWSLNTCCHSESTIFVTSCQKVTRHLIE